MRKTKRQNTEKRHVVKKTLDLQVQGRRPER